MTVHRISRGISVPVRRGRDAGNISAGLSGISLTRDAAGHILLSIHHTDGDALVSVLDDGACDAFANDLATLILADRQLADNDR